MNQRDFRVLIFGMLGVASCTVLWLAASGAFGGPPGDVFPHRCSPCQKGAGRAGARRACNDDINIQAAEKENPARVSFQPPPNQGFHRIVLIQLNNATAP